MTHLSKGVTFAGPLSLSLEKKKKNKSIKGTVINCMSQTAASLLGQVTFTPLKRGYRSFWGHCEGTVRLRRGGGGGAEPGVDMWEWLKFFTHSKHCFLLLLPAPVPCTGPKDFPGLGEMEQMMDQGRGKMTRTFLSKTKPSPSPAE